MEGRKRGEEANLPVRVFYIAGHLPCRLMLSDPIHRPLVQAVTLIKAFRFVFGDPLPVGGEACDLYRHAPGRFAGRQVTNTGQDRTPQPVREPAVRPG